MQGSTFMKNIKYSKFSFLCVIILFFIHIDTSQNTIQLNNSVALDTNIATDITFIPTLHEKNRNRRLRKTVHKTSKKVRKTLSNMDYEELLEAKNKYILSGNRQSIIKALETLLKLAPTVEALAEHMIELADIYYEEKSYTSAALLYNEFILFYKGHEKIEYAHFRARS